MDWFRKIPLVFYILAAYTLLSGYFAFERILNSDNSYYLFHILNYKHFWLPEYRLSDVFSQIPLLLFTHLNASLSFLIYTYSLSFPVEYLVIACICEYYLKVKEAALTLALALITGVAYSFFHPVTETYQALAFGILLYAILVSEKFKSNTTLYYVSIIGVSFLCFVSHPVAVFVIGFVSLFSYLSKQIRSYPFLVVAGLTALAVLLRILLTPAKSYDTAQYDTLYTAIRSLDTFGSMYPFLFLKTHLVDLYLPVVLLILVTGIVAFRAKHILLFFMSMVCSIGFAAIGILTFAKGDLDMMMEKTFMPSIFMILLLFCFLVFHQTNFSKRSLNLILLLVTLTGFLQICTASFVVTKRLNALTAIARQSTHPKLIAELSDFNDPSLLFNHWDTMLDSYFIAKCNLNQEFTLFITADKNAFQYDPANTSVFLGTAWHPYWNKKPENKTYFNLPAVGYTVYVPRP
jgi:hypothetical protein